MKSFLIGIWHVSGLIHSLNKNRRAIGEKLLSTVHKLLLEDGNTEDAQMIVESQKLFPELIDLAALQLKERKLKWRMSVRIDLKQFLVPTQGALRARVSCPPGSGSGSGSGSGPSQHRDFRTQASGSGGASSGDTSHYRSDPTEVATLILI